ncbi:hypothetical protein GQ457_09G024950 [Hibiscus cannabinus]
MTFQDPWYRYPKGGIDTQGTDTLREVSIPSYVFFRLQIPVAISGTDTQGEYRYPRAGTDTLKLGFPPNPRKGDESISELVEILSGEAKVVDVELG